MEHTWTTEAIRRKLFTDAKSFREIESRIEALPSKTERGNALEVFAETYLVTLKTVPAKAVWPSSSIPQRLLREYALPVPDKGVDGLVLTASDEHHAYQVKFRTGRPNLTWRELSTFVGISDKTDGRFLFTNCEKLPKELNDRGVYAETVM